MSQENVEAVRHSHDAVQRGDWEGAMACMSDDIVWDDSDTPGGGVYRGLDGVRRDTRRWLGSWDPGSFSLAFEYLDLGDKVVALGEQSGRGRGSGIRVTMDHFQVWTFRDGKATNVRLFNDRGMALAAVGLSE
jgi:uncharacterized protein